MNVMLGIDIKHMMAAALEENSPQSRAVLMLLNETIEWRKREPDANHDSVLAAQKNLEDEKFKFSHAQTVALTRHVADLHTKPGGKSEYENFVQQVKARFVELQQ